MFEIAYRVKRKKKNNNVAILGKRNEMWVDELRNKETRPPCEEGEGRQGFNFDKGISGGVQSCVLRTRSFFRICRLHQSSG